MDRSSTLARDLLVMITLKGKKKNSQIALIKYYKSSLPRWRRVALGGLIWVKTYISSHL